MCGTSPKGSSHNGRAVSEENPKSQSAWLVKSGCVKFPLVEITLGNEPKVVKVHSAGSLFHTPETICVSNDQKLKCEYFTLTNNMKSM